VYAAGGLREHWDQKAMTYFDVWIREHPIQCVLNTYVLVGILARLWRGIREAQRELAERRALDIYNKVSEAYRREFGGKSGSSITFNSPIGGTKSDE
jgi:hypothetical protein